MSEQTEHYLRGWRDGYGQGRDDEAADEPVRDGPPPSERQQEQPPRDRQVREPRRNR